MTWIMVSMMILFFLTILFFLGWFALALLADRIGAWVCGIVTVVCFMSFIILAVGVIINQ